MTDFVTFALLPAGLRSPALAIAASRAGGVGVVNGELEADSAALVHELDDVGRRTRGDYGLRADRIDAELDAALRAHARQGLRWLVLDAEGVPAQRSLIADLRAAGVKVLAEIKTPDWPAEDLAGLLDGLWVKGNEAGGFVGEEASYILIQKWLRQTPLPLYVRGGVTPHSAAACAAAGVAGGVLDAQLLLLEDSGCAAALMPLLKNLSGSETVAVGDGEQGEYFRILVRPGNPIAKDTVAQGESERWSGLRALVTGKLDWTHPTRSLLPIGQDVAFAAPWRAHYGSLSAVFRAIDTAVTGHLRTAEELQPISENGPLAAALGLRYPIVQGPMTRVSDTAEFALSVAKGGALPMVAFALLKGAPLDALLARTQKLLDGRHWGIGLLGFAPQSLLDEQLGIAIKYKPDYAIIAGGRPDQAVHLEQAGVPTFLHVPGAKLIPMFLQEGARRFIFEGRECGGHIGPLSSFVLWSAMVDAIAAELAGGKVAGHEIELLFAGGVHDAVSSAMVQVLTAPLAARGVRVGILMGSAYLFTREIVADGSIVPQFQKEVLECGKTINLESGPGHASRCAYTPFAEEYFRKRAEMRARNVPGDEARQVLDQLILGRLRIASKGRVRDGLNGELQSLDAAQQRAEGMYMLGQVATLRNELTDIETLHREVTADAGALLAASLDRARQAAPQPPPAATAADIAIVGMASVLPKAASTREFWENILAKVDAITEIPSHRWDWRLYFDSNRQAKDKIYSKWGGFLDDLPFDPVRYGMPPKSIESVDPMQLMTLEVAQRALDDAGYADKPFDRERASVIVGASGGAGDVGMQYGLRSELPRFTGALPDSVAERLPQWTEDTFAGILLNVVAGRIASRLNFGGTNFVTDAACASSLAAIYQGVSELTAGRSDIVLAGGVDTVQGPFGYLCFSKTQALSPRGRCATFSADGDGIVISEGIAMIVLKRLADAERDGDRIYAVIKGVGGSSDGNAKGLTAPLPAGQLRAMRRAYAQAGFSPRTVGLFEAHGTGTVAGDTAELESTSQLIKADGGARHQSAIGSVKTMIGHTKAAAGVAGLIKATLALHHRVLPPQLVASAPNPTLVAEDSPLHLIANAQPWLAAPDGTPRRAAVSAFGFGGTNFHIVLEEYADEYREWLAAAPTRSWPVELLVWSAPDRAALKQAVAATRAQLAGLEGVPLRHVAASLAHAFRADAETLAIAAADIAGMGTQIDAALEYLDGVRKTLPHGAHHGSADGPRGRIAVLFPGQGSQYAGMGREIALHFDTAADALAHADRVLIEPFEQRYGTGTRLSQYILPRGVYSDADAARAAQALTDTDIAQPALGAVEVALLRLLGEFGLVPDMATGHSYGEFVALHAAGAIDFDTLMRLSAVRGQSIVDAALAAGSELGTMAAVRGHRDQVAELIRGLDDVIIANHNAPLQVIISGSHAAIDKAATKVAQAGLDVTRLPVAAAFHSQRVKPARQAFAAAIDAMAWQAPRIPVYANATGRPHPQDPADIRHAMAEHLVCPVEFVSCVEAMHADGARVFVEIGPKPVLTGLVQRILGDRPHVAIALDRGKGLVDFVNALGQLVCAGIDIDVGRLFTGRECHVAEVGKLASLKPAPAISRTTWLLNGASARRAGQPQRQVGVTLEQASVASTAIPRAAAVAQVPADRGLHAVPPTPGPHPEAPTYSPDTPTARPPARTMHTGTHLQNPEERRMNEHRPAVTLDAAVMADYFETMRQFLDTQGQVMAAFMGAAPEVRVRAPARVAPRIAGPRLEPVAPAAPVPEPPVIAPLPASPQARSNGAVHAPAPVAAPVAAPQPVKAEAPEPAAMRGNGAVHKTGTGVAMSRDALTNVLLGIVEEKTGYPRDMVGLDQNLEADLGIDSIKRIEVVGAMLQSLPEKQREAMTSQRSKLNTQATLNGMLDLLAASLDKAAAA